MNNPEAPHQIRAAIYLRVSTDDQAEKYGLSLQQEAVEALLKSKGKLQNGESTMVLASEKSIYIDDGISGTIDLDERPAFARLKEDILMAPEGQRPFDVVAVYKIDRFARKLKILLEVIEFFEKYNIQFISANESIDTSTPFGKAMLGIIGVIAELEIETIKQRTQAGREEALKRGVVMGANTAFGYTKTPEKTLAILEPEAKVVRLIFDKFVNERYSAQELSNYLRENDYLTPDVSAVKFEKRKGEIRKKNEANFWRPEQVRELLQDEIYIGKYYYNKSKKGQRMPKDRWLLSQHRHPSIIDDILFEKAQLILKQHLPLVYNQQTDHIYLLSGLLRCDHCNLESSNPEEMMSWTGSKKRLKKGINAGSFAYSYLCGRKNVTKYSNVCSVTPIPATALEEYIVKYVSELLSNPVAVYNYHLKLKSTQAEINKFRAKKEEVQKLLNAIPFRKDRIREQHELRIIDTPTMKKQLEDLATKESKHKESLAKIEENIAISELSKGYEMSLNLFSEKYKQVLKDINDNRSEIFEILHLLVDKIIVYSRPVEEKDNLAGRKKPDQYIPNRLEIKLRLPKEIMQNLASRFGVENANL